MIIFDSNIWIAYIYTDDSQHAKAIDLVGRIETNIIVPEYVVLEVCSVLLCKKDKKYADKFIDLILSSIGIRIMPSSPKFFNNALGYFRKSENEKLSFVDVALLYLSRTYKIVTFDKQLQKAIDFR